MANWGRASSWLRSVAVLNSMNDNEWPRRLHFCLCCWNTAGIWHNEINSDGHLREGADLHCSLCFGPDFSALCRREPGGIMIAVALLSMLLNVVWQQAEDWLYQGQTDARGLAWILWTFQKMYSIKPPGTHSLRKFLLSVSKGIRSDSQGH